jgi:hypothetical protein
MENEVVIITSHANTDFKLDILNECIQYIKSFGYQIILSSHISVPDSILDDVDFFVYDKENRIINYWEYQEIPSGYYKYINFDEYQHTISSEFDHGYSVLRLIRNGLSLASINGFTKSHIVDYDYIIKDSNFFRENTKYLGNLYDIIGYRCHDYYFTTGIFSVVCDKILPVLQSINSVEAYSQIHLETIDDNKLTNSGVLENIFFYLIKKNNLSFFNIEEKDLDLELNEFDKINVFNNFYLIQGTSIEIFKSTDGFFDYLTLLNYGTILEYIEIHYKENCSIKINYNNIYEKSQSENSHISILKLPDWLKDIEFTIEAIGYGKKTIRKNENKAQCQIKNQNIIFEI